jgi:hypothetical protein
LDGGDGGLRMKICKTIKTGLHGFTVYAFTANFFNVNFFTGIGFTANLLSLIFFRENYISAKRFITVQKHFVSGYFVSGDKRPNEKSFGASGSWAEPCFACPTLCCGDFAYPPGILEDVFNCQTKAKSILGGILYIGI